MDMESGKQRLIAYVKKYRYMIWVVAIGIFLMLFPFGKEEIQQVDLIVETSTVDLEMELCEILNQISGVGKVQVLLTEESGSDTIYQMDTAQNQSNIDTVIVRGIDREETGLIKQVLPPVYRGAVIVCQGGDIASVRLAVVEAVKSVTGLSTDRISVLKMK